MVSGTIDGSRPGGDAPPALGGFPEERIVDVDVRDDLRNGREPFSRIMAARRELALDAVLRLRAIFEPVPLYAVMRKQGLEHWTEQLAADDWRVWFYPERQAPPAAAAPSAPAGAGTAEVEGEDLIVLDVRGMEPPEPMARTLSALDDLPAGKTLVQVNERVPHFLLPKLEELGFVYRVQEQHDALVRVFIRRADA